MLEFLFSVPVVISQVDAHIILVQTLAKGSFLSCGAVLLVSLCLPRPSSCLLSLYLYLSLVVHQKKQEIGHWELWSNAGTETW